MNKTLKVMTSAALLAGVVAPVAATTVSANSDNIVSKVLYVDDDYTSATKDASNVNLTSSENHITIKEDDVAFTSGDTFRLTLPTGVKFLKDHYKALGTVGFGTSSQTARVVSVTDNSLELELSSAFGTTATATADSQFVNVPLFFEVDGAEGEIKLSVEPRGTTLTAGSYTVAVVGEGNTSTSIASVKTIGDGDKIDTIRVDETSLRAIYDDKYLAADQEITLTLPSDFNWKNVDTSVTAGLTDNIEVGGGFTGKLAVQSVTPKDNKLTIKFQFTGKPTTLGTLYLKDLAIDADKDADFSDIEVDFDGDEVSSESLLVAKYSEYGTGAALEGDVPTLFAGRITDDTDDVKTVEVEIKESIAGSWLAGRGVTVEFPSSVKVLGVDVTKAENFKTSSATINDVDLAKVINEEIEGDSNEVEFDLPSGLLEDGKKSFKAKFFISTKADTTGDVTVQVSGRAGVEVPETVVAKVVAPVSVEVQKTDVRTGIKGQELGDIIITEAAKGAFIEGRQVRIWLSDGSFAGEPTITVEDGNLKIDQDSVDVDGNLLTFEVDSESTKASKIKISNVKLDLNRAVAEGDITVKVGGYALIQNNYQQYGSTAAFNALTNFTKSATPKFGDKTYEVGLVNTNSTDGQSPSDLSGDIDAGEFDQDYLVKTPVATVVTPAEGNVSAQTVTLSIGKGTMTVGDKEVALDAAPFIEASTGRTYLPLRAIANAIGANSVEWDNASRSATVIKGGLVAQMTIGQNAYVLNGAKIGMDGKAQIVKERTFLPIRALGNALGAQVEWDAATQTVTIK